MGSIRDSVDTIKKFEATFESYWNDAEFITFKTEEGERISAKRRLVNKLILLARTLLYTFTL